MTVQKPQSEAHVAAMFDRIAPRYDLLNRLLSAKQDQRWRRKMISMVPYRPRGRFLDVATGTGDVLLAAAEAHPEYEEWLGTDISAKMLERAHLKTQHHKVVDRTSYQVMSAEALELPDGRFDCLTIAFGLRNVVNREKALKEFQRVLKPGGVLLILEFFVPESGLLGRLFQFYFHRILPAIGGLISDRDAYTYLPQSVGSFYTPVKLRKVLYDSGFTVEEMKCFLFGGCRLVKAVKV